MMEEIFSKFIENTPILAVLAMYMFYSVKSQERRDAEASAERQQFINNYKGMSEAITALTENLEVQCEIMKAFAEGVMQAHQYQKTEHDQIVRILDRIDARK